MSVYTPITEGQLKDFLQLYSVGELIGFQGIATGVENTNYFVTTTVGEYVLTLVESVECQQMPFILNFIEHLSQNSIACAKPVHLKSGELFTQFNNRPAVLMSRLQGAPLDSPDDQQASIIGLTLARMHRLSDQLPKQQPVHIDQWCNDLAGALMPELSEPESHFLKQHLQDSARIQWTELPAGPIHGDLFPDNAMFSGEQLSGIIDFYHACTAPYLYDLCVTLNAWCYDEVLQQYDFNKALLILDSYQSIRPLNNTEQKNFSSMLQAAALRFWLSRLRDSHFDKPGEVVTRKDPAGKLQLLELLAENNSLAMAS